MKNDDKIIHYGVAGMHWGIRRYQPYGKGGYSPKKKGLYLTSGTANDANAIYDTLSRKEKSLVTAQDAPPSKYTTEEERSEFLVRSFVLKHGDDPVSLFDVWSEGDGDVALAVMTKSGGKYRRQGYGAKVVGLGMDWLASNESIRNAYWDVKKTNLASIRLAERSGFTKDGESVDHDGWLQYSKRLRE